MNVRVRFKFAQVLPSPETAAYRSTACALVGCRLRKERAESGSSQPFARAELYVKPDLWLSFVTSKAIRLLDEGALVSRCLGDGYGGLAIWPIP
jgi:hypothetical protein